MKVSILISFFCCYLVIGKAMDNPPHEGPEYYWRDFYNVMPWDAFIAGYDSGGIPFFVGQIFHISDGKAALVPIHVYGDDYRGEYAFNYKPYTVTKHFKILCTRFPEEFEWIESSNIDIRYLLPRQVFVEGGYDNNYPLLIGRTQAGDKIGKVTLFSKYAGLGYVNNDTIRIDPNFKVLTVKPRKSCNCDSTEPKLDVHHQ